MADTTYALTQVVEKGSGQTAKALDRPVAGKTGTSNSNRSAWFVGYTPQLSTAVWVGHPDRNISMQNIYINGIRRPIVYGSTIAAPTWKRFMDKALAGEPNKDFPKVSTKVLHGEKAPVPRVWGQSVDAAKKALEEAGFSVTVRPGQVYSSAPAGAVAYTSPSGTATKGTLVTIYVSNGQPEPPKKEDDKKKEPKKSDKKDDRKQNRGPRGRD